MIRCAPLGDEAPGWQDTRRARTRRYATDEQRRQPGWIVVQNAQYIVARVLTMRAALGILALLGCADDRRERELALDAETVGDGAAQAGAALERLVAAGRAAIPAIETALYGARIEGRLDLIVALRRIGDVAAVPLLWHWARWDEDERVRKEAEWTLRGWARGQDARATRAREAVRKLEESRADENAG